MQDLSLEQMYEIISHVSPPNTSIAVADANRFIHYKPSQMINLKIRPGDNIHQRTVTYKALEKKEKTADYVDEDVFGTPYYGTSYPIVQNGQLQGCITSILPINAFSLKQPFLTIRQEDCWLPTPFDEIIFIESEQRRTFVQSRNGFGRHQNTLRQLEVLLPEEFIRTHRSYIINVNHIKEIQPHSHSTFILRMTDDYRVPVSQTYASKFRSLLHF